MLFTKRLPMVLRQIKQTRVHAAGLLAGISGRPSRENPHTPGTSEHSKWLEGWHAGKKLRHILDKPEAHK